MCIGVDRAAQHPQQRPASSTGTSGVAGRVDGRRDRGDRLVGLRGGPAEPDQRLADLVPPGRAGGRRPAAPSAPARATGRSGPAAPAPAARRPSCRCPAPGSARPMSAVAIAWRTTSGGVHREHRLGQPRADPAGGLQQLEQLLARRRRRSRTGSASPPGRPGWWPAGPAAPTRSPARVPGVQCDGQADPADLDRPRRPAPTAATAPRTLAIIALLLVGAASRGQPASLRAGCRRARRGRSPAPARRRRRPAAAARRQPQQPGHHRRHLRLVGLPGAGDGRLDLARGVQSRPAAPARAPASTATAAGLRGAHHRPDVVLAEDPLDRDHVRPVLARPAPSSAAVEVQQPLRTGPRRPVGADHVVRRPGCSGRPGDALDHADAAPGQPRVDTEHPHGPPPAETPGPRDPETPRPRTVVRHATEPRDRLSV